MKNTLKNINVLLFILFISSSTSILAQSVNIRVDERVELVSIVGRLAQFEEYSQGQIKEYNEAIDAYFAPYKEHPIISLAQEYRKKNGLGYDALIWIAPHITIENSEVKINEFAYNNLDRWDKERYDTFVAQLADFYEKTNFNNFFQTQSYLYSPLENKVTDIFDKNMDYSWFDAFWGEKIGSNTFHIILAPSNGYANYGSKVVDNDQKEEIYSIMGTMIDQEGNPRLDANNLIYLAVHEICHSYSGEMNLDKMEQETAEYGKIIFSKVGNKMRSQAYPLWRIVLEEAMVRAATLNYVQNDTLTTLEADGLIRVEKANGFLWMNKLVDVFKTYQHNRDKYPIVSDMLPLIVNVYKEFADEVIANNFQHPEIIRTSVVNESTISPNITEIIYTFNKPMITKVRGIHGGGQGIAPRIEKIEWIDDTNLKISVKLEANKDYCIRIMPTAYFDKESELAIENNFDLKFKTKYSKE